MEDERPKAKDKRSDSMASCSSMGFFLPALLLLLSSFTIGVSSAHSASSGANEWREMDSSQGKGLQAAIPSKSWLPPVVHKAPRLAEASQQRPLRLRPSADLPAPVCQQTEAADRPLVSRPALEPSGAPARAAAPDATRLARPWRETGPDPDRANTTTDPAKDQVLSRTLALSPELRQKPAPYLHLAIPNPLSASAVIRLQKEPPDNDAPVAVTDRSLKPVLPTRSPNAPKP